MSDDKQPTPPDADTPPKVDDTPAAEKASGATKKAGKRRGRPAGSTDKAPRRTIPRASLESKLAEQFTMIGLMVSPFDSFDGQTIIEGAPNLAGALNKLADENASVRRALEGLLTGSAWGGVIVAAGSIVIPIAQHHNALPAFPGFKDTTPPPTPDDEAPLHVVP